jgi:hypothetical protein
MKLAGVRRQLEESRQALDASQRHAAAGEFDPAYRAALKARNLLFHATRGLAMARGEDPPEMPLTATTIGTLADCDPVRDAIADALSVEDDLAMPDRLQAARAPCGRYLGWLRDEVAKLVHPGGA